MRNLYINNGQNEGSYSLLVRLLSLLNTMQPVLNSSPNRNIRRLNHERKRTSYPNL
jgi:hypothetical protein